MRNETIRSLATIVGAAWLVACGGASAPPPAAPSTAVAAPKTPTELIKAGGTFGFSLADSHDARKLAFERCATDAKGDRQKAEACEAEVTAGSANEFLRFERDANGTVWWVSFALEEGKELLFYKTAITIDKEEGRRVFITPQGKAEGLVADKVRIPAAKDRFFEFTDEDTVQMTKNPESKKGMLVYRRRK